MKFTWEYHQIYRNAHFQEHNENVFPHLNASKRSLFNSIYFETINSYHTTPKIYALTVIFQVYKNFLFSDNPGQFSLGQNAKMPVFRDYNTFLVFSPRPSHQCWIEYMANASACIRDLQHCIRGAGKLIFCKFRQCLSPKTVKFHFVPFKLSGIVWKDLKIEKSNFCHDKPYKTC